MVRVYGAHVACVCLYGAFSTVFSQEKKKETQINNVAPTVYAHALAKLLFVWCVCDVSTIVCVFPPNMFHRRIASGKKCACTVLGKLLHVNKKYMYPTLGRLSI